VTLHIREGEPWNSEDVILFAPRPGSHLVRVAASGGTPVSATELDAERKEDAHYWPQFLPDGKHFLYLGRSTESESSGIFLAELPDAGKTTRGVLIKSSTTQGLYAAPPNKPDDGHLLFMTGRTIQAQRLDVAGKRVTGEPATIAEPVGLRHTLGIARSSVSRAGVLVYREIDETTRLEWFDREGRRSQAFPTAALYRHVEISPDQKAVALEQIDPQSGTPDIWILDTIRSVMTLCMASS
jgi:eukaryotic-like serine/threonine-protein kinase